MRRLLHSIPLRGFLDELPLDSANKVDRKRWARLAAERVDGKVCSDDGGCGPPLIISGSIPREMGPSILTAVLELAIGRFHQDLGHCRGV